MYEATGKAQVNKAAAGHTVLDLREPVSSVKKSRHLMLGWWLRDAETCGVGGAGGWWSWSTGDGWV